MTTTIDNIHLSLVIRDTPRVRSTQTCKETISILHQYPESPCIVVCDKSDQPIGLVMCNRFYLQMTGKLGIDSFYMAPIVKLMNRKPMIVDINSSIDSLRSAVARRTEDVHNDCIIVTQQGKLTGIINVLDLNRIQ